ncbi:MAG TPA: hypothetical protein VGS41_19160, partial [Chthonomonadales bacterium]|nr:hypothetical protein [Chthonomonadales bacterium]
MAAGCTSAINEADYHDFTSYFFAALTGRDRLGRPVSGADYNGDGRVGMDEAYCYTLIHDDSIDVPTCTSDIFLRRFVDESDQQVFRTPYDRIAAWATPAQRAALDALSSSLGLSGESRPAAAYQRMMRDLDNTESMTPPRRRFSETRREARRMLVSRWPALVDPESAQYAAAKKAALAYLSAQSTRGVWTDLIAAFNSINRFYQQRENREIADSRLIRFVRLAKSVVLAHTLKTGDNSTLKARYAQLVEAEGRSILPPVDQTARASNPAAAGSSLQAAPCRGQVCPLPRTRSPQKPLPCS